MGPEAGTAREGAAASALLPREALRPSRGTKAGHRRSTAGRSSRMPRQPGSRTTSPRDQTRSHSPQTSGPDREGGPQGEQEVGTEDAQETIEASTEGPLHGHGFAPMPANRILRHPSRYDTIEDDRHHDGRGREKGEPTEARARESRGGRRKNRGAGCERAEYRQSKKPPDKPVHQGETEEDDEEIQEVLRPHVKRSGENARGRCTLWRRREERVDTAGDRDARRNHLRGCGIRWGGAGLCTQRGPAVCAKQIRRQDRGTTRRTDVRSGQR